MNSLVTTTNTNKYARLLGLSFIIFFTFLPMLLTWILVGEFDLANRDWVAIAENKHLLVKPEPFIILFTILIGDIILYILLAKFKYMSFNHFSFMIATWSIMFAIFCTGLIVARNDNDLKWMLPVRVIVAIVSFALGFIISNIVVNRILSRTNLGQDYANEIISQEVEKEEYIEKNIKPFKHKKNKSNKKTDIEVKDK